MSDLNIYTQRQSGKRELGGALRQLGQQLVTAGRFDEARQTLELSLDLAPGQAECHFDLANVCYAAGRVDDAIAEYCHAVRLDPRLASAWYNLGVALMQSGRDREAERAYRRSLRFSPNRAETHNNLAILLQSAGRCKEAIQHYRCAAALRRGFYEPRFNLGSLFQDVGRLEEARIVFEDLLAECPEHTEASNNLANVLTELGRHTEARARFERVLEINPEHNLSRWNLGLNQLRMGDWTDGWKNYESRLRHSGAVRSNRPLWDGGELGGARILLMAEQGMGDLVQAARFVPMVAARGGRITIECHSPLAGLLRRMPDVEHVVEAGAALPDHDCWLPMMSLPRALSVTLGTLPAEVPYLAADASRVEHWRQRLTEWKGIKAGLAWSGNPKFRVNAKRSLGASEVRRVLKGTKQAMGAAAPVHFFSLQKGASAPAGTELIPLDDDPSSMDELAAVMMNLDLIVSVDTSVAHLAGALGRPVWTMLAFHADWRWMTADQARSPWYPTMRLLRQHRQGDWSNVLDEVEARLVAFSNAA